MGISNFIRKVASSSSSSSNRKTISITAELDSFSVVHEGEDIIIHRTKSQNATINPLFAKTNRPCPPFCIQPMIIAPNIETIGELELINYLQMQTTDNSIMIVDSRIKDWVDKGTIPSSINIPWTSLIPSDNTTLQNIASILIEKFGVIVKGNKSEEEIEQALLLENSSNIFDFSKVKTLVLFCNGSWCGQTTKSIDALLSYGFPEEKIKYYRDGMQGWESLGLTTIIEDNISTLKEPSCRIKQRR